MSNKARLIMLVISLALLVLVVWTNFFFQPEEPTYVKLREPDFEMVSGRSCTAELKDIRRVVFHRDTSEPFVLGTAGEHPSITAYEVHRDDVVDLIKAMELDPESEVIQLDPRLYRVRILEPYWNNPNLYKHGIATVSWRVIKVWSINDNK